MHNNVIYKCLGITILHPENMIINLVILEGPNTGHTER